MWFLGTGILEGVGTEDLPAVYSLADQRRCGCDVAGRGEVDAVVGEHGVDPIWHRLQQSAQEVGGDAGGGTLVQLGEGKLAGSVFTTKRWSLPCSVRTSAMSMWK
jgi:hypothetical protein